MSQKPDKLRRVARKPAIANFNQMRHKASCTTIDDGQRFETSKLDTRGILLFTVNKNTAQLRGYCEADMRLCFYIFTQADFPMMLLNIIFLLLFVGQRNRFILSDCGPNPYLEYFCDKMNVCHRKFNETKGVKYSHSRSRSQHIRQKNKLARMKVSSSFILGSVRGSSNGTIGNFTNGTIGLPMVPLAYQWFGTIGRANGIIGNTIGTNGITNGTIGRTLNDNGIPLVPLVEP